MFYISVDKLFKLFNSSAFYLILLFLLKYRNLDEDGAACVPYNFLVVHFYGLRLRCFS